MWKVEREMERLFRDQFRVENGRLVFRRNTKDAPVAVTDDEAETAVRRYLKRNRISLILFLAVTLVLVMAASQIGDGHLLQRSGYTWAFVLPLIGLILIGHRWSWYGSVDHFTRRTPVGSERSREEIRAELLGSWGWPRLLGMLAFGLVVVGSQVLNWPPATWDDWIWLGLGTFLVLASLLNCLKKWELQRRGG